LAYRALVLLAFVGVAGCAGAGFNGAAFQGDVAAGNYDRALASLKAFPKDDVSALLDRALLLQARGDRAGSNASFEAAELRIADLYTRSLSREALSLLTGDLALEYRAAAHEHAYIAYFRSWNYLDENDREGVLVEARRIGERLDYLSASCPGEDGACGHDVFLRYWSGLLFEWGGEINDAYVAYKNADESRSGAGTRPAGEVPADLGARLVASARRLGFDDEVRGYASRYGLTGESAPAEDCGTVVLAWENGIVGHREETGAVIPIFEGETQKIRDDRDEWSRTLAGRRDMRHEKVKLDYLLRIALPVFVEAPPQAVDASFGLGSVLVEPQVVAPLSAMAGDALDRAMGGIVVRAVARALTKYLAKEAAEDEIGEGAGILINLLGLAFESAETRSWRSLPHEIRLAVVPVRAGAVTGTLRMIGRGGEGLEDVRFENIPVAPGRIVFLRHRSAR